MELISDLAMEAVLVAAKWLAAASTGFGLGYECGIWVSDEAGTLLSIILLAAGELLCLAAAALGISEGL